MKRQRKMTSLLIIGLTLMLIGIIFVIISAFASKSKVHVAGGFGGFIGPIPFGFFSSPGMFWIWLVLFVALLLIWFVFFKLYQGF